jgi:hypothetical protein
MVFGLNTFTTLILQKCIVLNKASIVLYWKVRHRKRPRRSFPGVDVQTLPGPVPVVPLGRSFSLLYLL